MEILILKADEEWTVMLTSSKALLSFTMVNAKILDVAQDL